MWELDLIKKAECGRIDAFVLCWRRLLRVPWTARRSNQSILKEISPECSLKDWCWSWDSNTLTTWCKERTQEKTLMLEKIEGWRRKGRQKMRCLDGITESMDMDFNELQEFCDGQGGLACCSSWHRKESDTTERLNWAEWNPSKNCLHWRLQML